MKSTEFIALVLISMASAIGLAVLATRDPFDTMISEPDDRKAAQTCLDHGFPYFQRLSGVTVICRNDDGREDREVSAARFLDSD